MRATQPLEQIPASREPGAHYRRIADAVLALGTSRRGMLLAIGAAAGLPLAGNVARAATRFSVDHDATRADFRVAGVPAWRVDAAWFDGRPKLKCRAGEDVVRLRLAGALFPGTDICADFVLEARRQGAHWQAELALPGLGFCADVCFDRWLIGLEAAQAPFVLARGTHPGADAIQLLDLEGSASFSADWSFAAMQLQRGAARIAGQENSLQAWRHELVAADAEEAGRPASRMWLRLAGERAAQFDSYQAKVCLREAADGFAETRRGSARVLLRSAQGAPSELRLKARVELGVPLREAGLLYEFGPGRVTTTARGDWSSGGWLDFDGGSVEIEPPARPLLLASTAPGLGPAAFRLLARRLLVPVEGADHAVFEMRPLEEQEKRDKGELPQPLPADVVLPEEYDIGDLLAKRPRIDPFDLVLRRAVDGLFCRVRFKDVRLVQRLRGWYLVGEGAPLIEFDFGSQHLREEAVYFEAWCKACNPGNPSVICQPSLPAFEAAGTSRLVFSFHDGAELPLGLDALFAWAREARPALPGEAVLLPRLSVRAAEAGVVSLADSLAFPGTAKEDRKDRDLVINDPRSLAQRFRPDAPGYEEHATRIEAPAGLVVSPIPRRVPATVAGAPDEFAPPRWAGSRAPSAATTDDGLAEVWNVRLSGVDVRALYSPKAKLTVRNAKNKNQVDVFAVPAPYQPGPGDFRASYDARALHQIVALSGVYGFTAPCGTSQVQCKADAKEGNYMPAPLRAELLLLSSQGASFRYRGRWDPPGELALLRYDHDAQLGRDTLVRIEEKGYLFPLGQPAIHVTLTERRFCMEDVPLTKRRQLVSRLVQRKFIHVPALTRTFPAIGQPHARYWGHAETGMETTTTADIVEPANSRFGGPASTAFWPTLPGGVRVLFDFQDPQTGATYRAPLVFVPKDLAHTPAGLAPVITTWRSAVAERRNLKRGEWTAGDQDFFARVTSARLPFLPGQRSDRSDIETHKVLLDVAVPGDATYEDPASYPLPSDPAALKDRLAFTTRMEAADQPPFYPVRRRAQISPTELAVLTGETAVTFLVEFDRTYLAEGVSGPNNPAQVFAVFARDQPKMDFSGDTSRSGGFASPSAGITWLSLKRGAMGGPFTSIADPDAAANPVRAVAPALAPAAAPAPAAALVPAPQVPHDEDFDPRKYFASALGDARLLGVVRLVDVLEVLVQATGPQIPVIRRENLYDLARPAMIAALDFFDARVREAGKWVEEAAKRAQGNAQASPEDLAALRLKPDWDRLAGAVAAARKVAAAPVPSTASLLAASSELGSGTERLAGNVRSLARDPSIFLPAGVREYTDKAKPVLALARKVLPPDEELMQPLLRLAEEIAAAQLRERLVALAADLERHEAFAAMRAVVVRLLDFVVELDRALRDAALLVDALRRDLPGRLSEVVQEFARQAEALLELTRGACTQTGTSLASVVLVQAQGAMARAQERARSAQDFVRDLGSRFGELENLTPELQAAQAPARQLATALANIVDAELAQLEGLREGLPDASSVAAALCGGSGDAARRTRTVVLNLLEYLLLAPGRMLDSVSLLAQLAKTGIVANVEALAKKRLSHLVDSGVLADGEAALRALAGALPLLKGELQAAEAAALAVRTDIEAQLKSDALLKQLLASAQPLAARAQQVQQTVAAARSLLQMLRAAGAEDLPGLARAEIERRLRELANEVQRRLETALDGALGIVRQAVCARVAGFVESGAIASLGGAPYLAAGMRKSLDQLDTQLRGCGNGKAAPALRQIFTALADVAEVLGRTVASGNVGRLVDLERVTQELAASLGVPTRVRVSYDWATSVSEAPRGSSAIFEPRGARQLTIASVIEASLTGGKPQASLKAELAPFAIHLFGKGPANFLSIEFDGLRMSAEPGQALVCDTDVTQVKPGPALGFVNRLSALFGARSGFIMRPGLRGITVGYQYGKPIEVLGGFTIQNIDLAILADLPFDNSPVRTTLRVSEKETPFLISAGIYGGGGFLALRTRADTLEMLEASFEYGGVSGFAFGPVVGTGRITAGIYIRMGGRSPVVQGFFVATGQASVARIFHVSATLRVALTYDGNSGQARGSATYTFKFKVGFLRYRYSARVAYSKSGDKGAGSAGAALEPVRPVLLASAGGAEGIVSDAPSLYAGLFSDDSAAGNPGAGLLQPSLPPSWPTWRRYWQAFAPVDRPPLERWMSASRPAASFEAEEAPRIRREMLGGLDEVKWMVVPWGFGRDPKDPAKTGMLRIGLRANPALSGLTVWTRAARNDWPGTVAAAHVRFGCSGASAPPEAVDIGHAYLRRLAEWGLTIADATRLWRAIFPESLASPPPAAAGEKAHATAVGLARHDTYELARLAQVRSGELFLDALPPATAKSAAFAPVVDAPVGAARKSLAGLARLYGSMREPAAPTLPEFETKSRSADPYVRWLSRSVMGARHRCGGDDAKVAELDRSLRAQYSAKAFASVFSRESLPSNERLDRLAELFAQRQANYRSDEDDCAPAASGDGDDFHKRLAGLVAHPWLLKVLGLVIDLEVPVGIGCTAIWVWSWGRDGQPDTPYDRPLRTQVSAGFPAARPVAQVKDPSGVDVPADQYVSGTLDVSGRTKKFLLSQVDVDRTPHRMLQTALAWRTQVEAGALPKDVRVTMQPQETVGLSLIERRAADQKEEEGDDGKPLYLQDLLAGWRPDVQRLRPDQDPAGARVDRWTSLTARRVKRVRMGGRDITHWFRGMSELVDEAVVFEAVRELDPGQPGSAYLVEGERFRWDGWMFGAPRPDAAAEIGGAAPSTEALGTGELEIDYEALPGGAAQRYGSGYRVGVRLAMVDGNSIALEEAERLPYAQAETKAVTIGSRDDCDGHAPFLRYEPIMPPTVLMADAPRSVSALHPQRAARVVVAAGVNDRRTHRVIVPPRCASVELAIRHGMFDAPTFRETPPPSAFPEAVLRPDGSFPSMSYPLHGVVPGKNATQERYWGLREDTGVPPRVPYYPDPWATRAILGFFRAGDDQLLFAAYFDYYEEASWPLAQALHLEFEAVDTVPDTELGFEYVHDGRKRIVRLAPGTLLKLRVWHEMNHERLEQSAIVDQIVQARAGGAGGPPMGCGDGKEDPARKEVLDRLGRWHDLRNWDAAKLATPRGAASDSAVVNVSSFWMLNPMTEIELVHAVERPLHAPEFSDAVQVHKGVPAVMQLSARTSGDEETAFRVIRQEAQTHATFSGDLRLLDRATTRAVDALARWRDNARKPMPRRKDPAAGNTVAVEDRQALLFQLRDIPAVITKEGGIPESPQPPRLGHEQRRQRLDLKSGANRPLTAPFDFGDTRARVIDVELLAYGRHADRFPGAERDPSRSIVRSRPKRVIVPGAQRPEAPSVEYVMPLYRWRSRAPGAGGARRVRESGWFRVWLGDRWYSSGNGELLALVCWHAELFDPLPRALLLHAGRTTPQEYASPPSAIESMVTRWGLDPLVQQDFSFGNIPASAFRNRLRNLAQVRAGAPADDPTLESDLHHLRDVHTYEPQFDLARLLPKPDDGDTRAVLALYRPRFDAESGRWYADIQIDSRVAYQPFVRLALARWQPHALQGERLDLRLSPVVSTAFVQLLPERSVTIVARPRGEAACSVFDVTVAGPAPGKGGRVAGKILVRAEEFLPDRFGGVWRPLKDACAGPPQWEAKPRDAQAWTAAVSVPADQVSRTSLVIEEYERLGGDAPDRPVFFDRIALRSL